MLKGKLIHLRPAEEEDIGFYLAWISEANLARLVLGSFEPIPRIQIRNALDKSLKSPGDRWLFTIQKTFKKEPVGFCFLKNIHPRHRLAEIEQFFIGEKKYRRNGYGGEAMEILLKYAFTELNLNRLWLITYAYNQPAIMFYEKAGFIREGLLRQIQYTCDCYNDGILMAILKEDWIKKNSTGEG